MNIYRLNRSSKVFMEKGPARHTRTPLSSLPEPNTFFQRILSRRQPSFPGFPGRIALPYTSHITKLTHLLLNEYCRRSPRCSPLSAAEHSF